MKCAAEIVNFNILRTQLLGRKVWGLGRKVFCSSAFRLNLFQIITSTGMMFCLLYTPYFLQYWNNQYYLFPTQMFLIFLCATFHFCHFFYHFPVLVCYFFKFPPSMSSSYRFYVKIPHTEWQCLFRNTFR